MTKNRVKIVGYAQRVFYNNGIEYRNFSDNLVGQQLTENSGTTLFTSGNFIVTTNMDPKISKMFKTNEFSDFVTLNSLDLTDNQIKLINETNRLKLNLNNSILTNYAYFGSLREFIRVSLEHIIINWPASIYVSPKLNGVYLTTVEDYTYNNITNISSFKTNTNYLNNSYNVKFLKNAIITDSYNNISDNKNLSVNYSDYTISASTGEYNIIGYTGSTYSINDYIYFEVNGNPFSSVTQSVEFHIKPNNTKINEFFISLPDFEKYLLNRQTHPIYTSKFSYTVKTDTGIVLNTEKQLTWPVSDGYNINFDTTKYITFVSDLVELADNNDLIQSDIINRSLVSNSISEFDTTSDSYDEIEQKINKTLRIYGREFDEIKRFNDGLALANVVSYNKRDNAPDSILKGLARTLGWDLTSSLEENDFVSSFLTTTQSTHSGQTISLTKSEAEIEMWRRIILNTPWIWKSKGTRKAIEFFFKFIGAPNGLINFNEYLYIANTKLNMDEFVRVLEINTGSSDYSYLPIDDDGYPKVLSDNTDMYFQKGGLWYRQTGGIQSDLDILGGNNPHIGPYDGGYAYINQFKNLIPNFSSTTLIDEVIITGKTNLFYNYNNGIVNGLINTTVSGSCNVSLDFNTILLDETQDCYNNNNIDVDITECSFDVNWSTLLYLNGDLVYTSPIFHTSSDRLDTPTENDYINSLQSGATVLGLDIDIIGNDIIITKNNDSYECVNDYEGVTLESKLKLNTQITSVQMTGYCESIIKVCNTIFKSSGKQPILYIESIDSSNTSTSSYDITTSIIHDPYPTIESTICGCETVICDNSIKIDIKKKIPVYECGYINYVLDEIDECAIFTMPNGDTTKYVSSECCPSGYEAIDSDICETRCKKKPEPIIPPDPLTCTYDSYYYNQLAAQSNIAPTGWSVPTQSDWKTLANFLISNGYNYDDTTVGNKIAVSMALNECWVQSTSPHPGNNTLPLKNNSSGLSFRPNGFRSDINGAINMFSIFSTKWMSSGPSNQLFVGLGVNSSSLQIVGQTYPNTGMGIRCVKNDNIEPTSSVVYDIDGNKYGWVKLGNQIWLDRDLIVTKFNDGTPIPLVQDNTDWVNQVSAGYSVF